MNPDDANKDQLPKRGILVMVFGHKMYIDMAKRLMESLKLHSPNLPIALATSVEDPELRALADVIVPDHPTFNDTSGMIQKMNVDLYAPFEETIYIDSDCLIFGDITPMFDQFQGLPVGLLGDYVTQGHYYTDVTSLLKKLGLEKLPRFCAGMIYLNKAAGASRVYDAVRAKIPNYDSYGFKVWRGGVCDEPLISLTLAEQGVPVLPDDFRSFVTLAQVYGPLKVDVLRGKCSFDRYEFVSGKLEVSTAYPTILHFAGAKRDEWLYWREKRKIAKWHKSKGNRNRISTFTNFWFNSLYVPYAFVTRLAKRIVGLNRRRPRAPEQLGFSWP